MHVMNLTRYLELKALLKAATLGVGLSIAVLIVSVVMSYPLAYKLSLAQQIFAHMVLLVSGLFIKLSYLLRCYAQHSLHLRVD